MPRSHCGGDAEIALLPNTSKLRVYRVRWWLLVLASGIAGGQGGIWVTYGVVAEAVKPLYGWDDSTIALLANWGPICYLLAAAPTSYLLDMRGPRSACVVGSGLMLLGGIARICRQQTDAMGTLLAHAGQISNALAGPVAMSVGPVLSSTWFAPSERVAATAIVASANYGGTALVFWLGSQLVPAGLPDSDTRERLWWFMVGECVLSCSLFVCCVLSFPSRPPSPPSRSATITRESPSAGLRLLSTSRSFWMLALSYGVSSGAFQGWGALLGPNMQGVLPAGDAEKHAGLLGCWGAIAGAVAGVVLGVGADRVPAGKRKGLLVGTCAVATLCFVGFALVCAPALLPPSWTPTVDGRLVWMYATCIGGSAAVNAAIPLYFELAVEATYPVAEGLTTTSFTVLMNLLVGLFLALPSLPTVGTAWMNWALVGACALATLSVLPLSVLHNRLAVDMRTIHSDLPRALGTRAETSRLSQI